MNYRYSLNLPYTDFSMKANLSSNEKLILDYWNNINLYYLISSSNRKIKFLINDGPPYANGNIHIGHAFNKILKDFINKFKFLDGFEVNFIPGWDCHGLPIELNVEYEIGKIGPYLSRSDFRKACRIYAKKYINLQKLSFIRLGVIGDWDNCYETMDYDFESSIIDSLSNALGRGYIYNGVKPVYWCFDCKSALAEAEVDYFEKDTYSLYIFFSVLQKNFLLSKFKFLNFFDIQTLGIIIWTTTPWTLPFNEAVALNPNSKYVLLKNKNNGYIFDFSLIETLVKKLNIVTYEVLCVFFGKDLNNLELLHPLYNKVIKVILSEHVKNDSGTGCVHIAPAYGFDDYKLGVKYNLNIINGIDSNGFFLKDILFFENLHIEKVNLLVLDKLNISDNLLFLSIIKHRYPHCWRHKTPLIYMSTEQWFIKITENLKLFLKKSTESLIKWIPGWGKERMKDMISFRPDWCISRQRSWGVPIVLLFDKKNRLIYKNISYVIKYISNKAKIYGTDIWYDLDIHRLFNIDYSYTKIDDVLDVWYDSSVVFYFLLNKYKNLNLPFSLCLEGSDQYRGWFQVSLINSLILESNVQCDSILTHGFVLDKFDRKMSKSLNNVISPSNVVDKYGADILRLWVASSNYIVDINISDEILMRICDAYRRIRNTARFLLSNLYDFRPSFDLLEIDNLLEIDKWMLYSLFNMQKIVLDSYRTYNFHVIYKIIYNFCLDELGSKYLDIIKDRLYTNKKTSISRKSVQSVIYYMIIILSKLLSPILSFTSEEIWNLVPGNKKNSVFISIILFNINKLSLDINFWNNMFLIKNEINKLLEKFRKNDIIKSTLDAEITLFCSKDLYKFLSPIKDELHYFFVTSNVKLFLLCNILEFYNETEIEGLYVTIRKSLLKKCERCWHRSINTESNLCDRCIDNLYCFGENRVFI